MRIGFTGTQAGMSQKQLETLRELFSTTNVEEFHHGDCIGSDADAHDIAAAMSIRIFMHPPKQEKKRAWKVGDYIYTPKEYLERNHDIVNAVDYLIAAPKRNTEELRSGTWATIRYARKVGVSYKILLR